MADTTIITPLSGEIMSGTAATGANMAARDGEGPADIVDAEFETLPRTGHSRAPHSAPPAPPVPGGLAILASKGVSAGPRRAGASFWAGGALLALAAFWMAGGHALMPSLFPGEAAPKDAIRVAALTSRVTHTASGEHLVIDGELQNRSAYAAAAPDLVIEVAALAGDVIRYRLGNGGAMIDSGGAWRFSSRLSAPNGGVRSVSVSVAGREDN